MTPEKLLDVLSAIAIGLALAFGLVQWGLS
jgi:hypothetical protein